MLFSGHPGKWLTCRASHMTLSGLQSLRHILFVRETKRKIDHRVIRVYGKMSLAWHACMAKQQDVFSLVNVTPTVYGKIFCHSHVNKWHMRVHKIDLSTKPLPQWQTGRSPGSISMVWACVLTVLRSCVLMPWELVGRMSVWHMGILRKFSVNSAKCYNYVCMCFIWNDTSGWFFTYSVL